MMYGTLLNDNVYVKQEPEKDSKNLGTLIKGQSVIIDKKYGEWYSIYYGDKGGYVCCKYVEPYMFGKVININSSLNVRQEPNTTSEVIGSLTNGEFLKISTLNNNIDDWYFIFYGDSNGYVYKKYVESYILGKVININSSLNVRQEPNTTSEVIGNLKNGDNISILDELDEWYCVIYENNRAYVSKKYVIPYLKNDIAESIKNINSISYDDNLLISDKLVNFIKSYEGFYEHPYYDQIGNKTIGYGSTHGWIMDLDSVTEEQATKALLEEINKTASIIKTDLDKKCVVLKQNEFDALCSFAYNCGVGALFGSKLYKRICHNVRDSSLKSNFKSWCHGNGKIIKGLLNRRIEEYNMFIRSDYSRNL